MSLALVEPTDRHVIALSGAVSPATVIALHRTTTAAVDAGHDAITVDLSAVTLLGAQTAGLFCGAMRGLARRGVVLEILGGPANLQRTLAVLRASGHVTQGAQRSPGPALALIADPRATNVSPDHPSTVNTAA